MEIVLALRREYWDFVLVEMEAHADALEGVASVIRVGCGPVPHGLSGLRALALVALLSVTGCAAGSRSVLCTDGRVSVDVSFDGAGNHACLQAANGQFLLTVTPEGRPINPSPWYAFRLHAEEASRVTISLQYQDAEHRYQPKISSDGQAWRNVDTSDVTVTGNSATFRANLERGVTYIAAQPIEMPAAAWAWGRRVLVRSGFQEVEYGRSVDGRPLVAFVSGGGEGLIVAITRQHPPETQGAAAFRAFAERLASANEDARAFRANNRIVLAPMANPDGVVRGHWRHNAGGVDLNRDWQALSQPETRALTALIEREAVGRRVRSFIDFHATHRTVIYAPPLDAPSPDIGFLSVLESRFRADLQSPPAWAYDHRADSGVSKAWALEQLQAPGITLEVSDSATEEQARALGRAAADALIDYAADS